MLSEISAISNVSVEYGYVVGIYNNIRTLNPGLNEETGRITAETSGVKKIICSNSEDHKSFADYNIFSLVITYNDTSSANENTDLVARPYVKYTDAQGVSRTFYGEYTGSSTAYGGCKINYTAANTYISNIENGLTR